MADVSGVDNLTSSSNGSTSLAGIKSAIDNLNTAKVETTVTVNGHPLSANVIVTNTDLGSVPTTRQVNGKELSADITLRLASADFANQGTATTLLHGNASGNPTFSAVVEGDQTLSDVTTNDVSTSKHGYAPKAPNTGTKFLRDDATWAVPSAGLSFKSGVTTRDVSLTSAWTIAHGLGVTPKYIRIKMILAGSGIDSMTEGTYNGSSQCVVIRAVAPSSSSTYFQATDGSTIAGVYTDTGPTNHNNYTAAVDSTNITLTASKTGSPTGTAQVLWEAFG